MTVWQAALALGVVQLSFGLGTAAAGDAWLSVTVPADPVTTTEVPILEVKGHAGSRVGAGHDLVIAIDLSDSTLGPCGVDLDGDGPDGRSDPGFLALLVRRGHFPLRLATRVEHGLDLEDTVLAAELEAARALLERLDPRRFRVGIVVFSDDAEVAAPLGTPPAGLVNALDEVRLRAPSFLRGTNLAAAIDRARAELAPPDIPLGGRERSLVVLTDGVPTLPIRGGPGPRAEAAAIQAGVAGVRVYPFAIGAKAEAATPVLAKIARATGGRFHRVRMPAEVALELRRLDLVDLAGVQIENLTTGSTGRALRTFPDGSFDGFVKLVAGVNRIRVEALHTNGTRHVVERAVRLRPDGDAAASVLRERVDALQRRTRELQVWAEMEARRRRQARQLELEVERAQE